MSLLRRILAVRNSMRVFRVSKCFAHTDAKEDPDMPVEMESPFLQGKPKCLLCNLEIEPNFKNVRLLSQFVSRHTGRVYGRHITGLCREKQQKLMQEVTKARSAGLMAYKMKEPKYFDDPLLYDESNPLKVHKYI